MLQFVQWVNGSWWAEVGEGATCKGFAWEYWGASFGMISAGIQPPIRFVQFGRKFMNVSRIANKVVALLLALTVQVALASEGGQENGLAVPGSRYIVKLSDTFAGLTALEEAGASIAVELPAHKAVAARIPDQAVPGLMRHPGIDYIELDGRWYTQMEKDRDSRISRGVEMLAAPVLWFDGVGEDVTVCIIDSGMQVGHESLQEDRLSGFSAAGDWGRDECGHGTHVTGIIAGLDNGLGFSGVLPQGVDLHHVKVFSERSCSWAHISDVLEAVDACVDAGADIINMSLGGPSHSTLAASVLARAWGKGALLVAAAGNGGTEGLMYPAAYPAVVSVAAVDEDGRRPSFSQHNDHVELAAPGVSIASTTADGGYGHMSGTSMAAAHVSGVAALLKSYNPDWTNAQIREALAVTAKDLGPTGRDPYYGHGLVRADAALAHLGQQLDRDQPGPEFDVDLENDNGSRPQLLSEARVSRVDYLLHGGSQGDSHLVARVVATNSNGRPLQEAHIAITVYRNGSVYASKSGVTAIDGVFELNLNNAPAGCYFTKVIDLARENLEWDGEMPFNEVCKGPIGEDGVL